MADSYIQLPPDNSGKKLDADQLAVGGTQVYRERSRLAGGAAGELTDVRNGEPGSTDYGVCVRPVGAVLMIPANGIGKTPVSVPLQAINTIPHTVVTGNVAVATVLLVNETSGDIAVYLSDLNGSPLIYGTSVPALTTWPVHLGCIEAIGGLQWRAGSLGLYGAALGYQA
jgi:hypothetical protein